MDDGMDDGVLPEDGQDWPLPPAWMWGCEDCFRLYREMKHPAARDPLPGAAVPAEGEAQLGLARHIAAEHRAELPGYAATCRVCVDHQARTARDRAMGRSTLTTEQLAREHRARHAFVPDSTVHLP
ncbi:hypothetical protein [Streptomyces sp. NPDC047097]|uniref:hypothetical protein n=1 Tax=Streptomyces sp. NPDC047097 TaxID=3155260 RepID=UPI0033E8D75A